MKLRTLFLSMLPLSGFAAEDGKVLYTTYCSACHGVDGKGPEANINPPLAKSEWITGSPDRAISAVLVGLKGPIETAGKLYNLQMPAQGAIFNDEQLAAVMTYVRSSWGNKEKAVTPEQVAKVRAGLKGRAEPFTAHELKKKHPIKYSQGWPRLKNLKSYVYKGKWETMPDFSTMKPISVEEEPRNLVDTAHAPMEKEFAIVWEGDLMSDREGDFNAMLDSSDGSVLYVNDTKVLEVEGIGLRGSERARIRRFRMKKGANKFRLEYFNNQGNPGLSFKMSGPTGAHWMSESRLTLVPAPPKIMLTPPKNGAVLYRHFIRGARERAIGVGYDGGVNQAFSITHMGLDVIWQGDFIDGGKHWTNRGHGSQKPAGTDVVRLLNLPGYAVLENDEAEWPDRKAERILPEFGGYSLDEKSIPTFRYQIGEIKVTEHSSFLPPGKGRSLVRKITYDSANGAPEGLNLALASGPSIKSVEGGFLVDEKVTVSIESDAGLIIKERKGKQRQLLVPLQLKKGITTLTVTYTWN